MQGAKQVLFTFFPPHVSDNFYAYASSSGHVVFGRKLIQMDAVLAGALELEPLPQNLKEGDVLSAVYALAPIVANKVAQYSEFQS